MDASTTTNYFLSDLHRHLRERHLLITAELENESAYPLNETSLHLFHELAALRIWRKNPQSMKLKAGTQPVSGSNLNLVREIILTQIGLLHEARAFLLEDTSEWCLIARTDGVDSIKVGGWPKAVSDDHMIVVRGDFASASGITRFPIAGLLRRGDVNLELKTFINPLTRKPQKMECFPDTLDSFPLDTALDVFLMQNSQDFPSPKESSTQADSNYPAGGAVYHMS